MTDKGTRKAPRHKLEVDVVISDPQSGIQIRRRTRDLNCYGCGVGTVASFPIGTIVMLRFTHDGEKMAASGRVIYEREDIGMGIVFTSIEPGDLETIENWTARPSFLGQTRRQ